MEAYNIAQAVQCETEGSGAAQHRKLALEVVLHSTTAISCTSDCSMEPSSSSRSGIVMVINERERKAKSNNSNSNSRSFPPPVPSPSL